MKKIILASASPRRKQILENLGLKFEIVTSNVDETVGTEYSPYEWVKTLSIRKAEAVKEKVCGDCIIIAADTIVTDLGRILNKPIDKDDAIQMLKSLQGKKHTVYTGVTIIFRENGNETTSTFVDGTDVFMRSLTDDEINDYVNKGEPFDKEGAYAIQGKGSLLIESIDGDYYTVVGLPVYSLQKAFCEHGVNIMNYWKK